ncbi:UNVERIFIED_ORG: hypothetical protein B2H93_14455 [Clostridium botulinum]
MSRVYNIVDRVTNGIEKPTLKIDEEHEFKINNSFPVTIAIKAYSEDKELDDMDRIKKIIGTALDKEANEYIESLELPTPLYTTIINVIMAAISDMSLEEMENMSNKKPRNK